MKSYNFNKINKFRFEAKWLLKESFMEIVKKAWKTFSKGSSAYQLVKKTNLLKKKLSETIFRRNKRIKYLGNIYRISMIFNLR